MVTCTCPDQERFNTHLEKRYIAKSRFYTGAVLETRFALYSSIDDSMVLFA